MSHIFEKESSVGVHRLGSANEESRSAGSSSNGESASEKSAPQHKRRGSDPHPHNFLTRMDTDAALAMTGMAHHGLLTKTEGTWCFWSPEMCEGSQAFSGYAADMWAAGVCLYIFVTGRLPWYSEIPTDLFGMIGDAEIDYSGLGLSNSLIDLLKRCLEKCPGKRAGVGDCLKHPFLQVARAKRIRRLSTEFENSNKRKIVLNEDDIRAVCTKKLYLGLSTIALSTAANFALSCSNLGISDCQKCSCGLAQISLERIPRRFEKVARGFRWSARKIVSWRSKIHKFSYFII